MSSVAVCVPSIPPRASMLAEALTSVAMQTRPVDQLIVVMDYEHKGAAAMLNWAMRAVDCEWTAFLGDDDTMYPQHIARLLATATETGADVIYPYFDRAKGGDPLGAFGRPFDPVGIRSANYVPGGGSLVRTAAIRAVDGFPLPGTPDWPHAECEDWGLWLRLLDAGYTFHHLAEETWVWRRWQGNTSGRGDRWRS